MSISTSGGEQRRPSVVSTGKKAPAGKAVAEKTAEGGPAAGDRAAADGRATGIIGYGAYAVILNGRSWEEKAAAIDGIVNYRESDPSVIDPLPGKKSHEPGPQTYKINPPVGSTHNNAWQNCMGDVYDAPIANEHAVHSLEHGAVWITYRPDLPADQVEKLANKVRGNEYMMMSPVENLDRPISLQAWGYQLKVDDADDGRIDEFIDALRVNASVEPGASCSGGITATGTTPRDNVAGDTM